MKISPDLKLGDHGVIRSPLCNGHEDGNYRNWRFFLASLDWHGRSAALAGGQDVEDTAAQCRQRKQRRAPHQSHPRIGRRHHAQVDHRRQ